MTQVELNDSCAINIPFENPASVEAFFIFGLHKCGSTLLNKIFVDICKHCEIPSISIPEIAFKQGMPTHLWEKCQSLNSIVVDGYCHRGFRHYPQFLNDNKLINQRKKILLVRDPRDAIVSAYFSFAKSHTLPKSGKLLDDITKSRQLLRNIPLEDYALTKAVNVKKAFNIYHDNLSHNSLLKIYKYEDIIFDKYNWISEMVEFLGFSISNEQILSIANMHDILPSSEDENQHIRKVKPGDHIDKLSLECISRINKILADVLERYNYEH